MTRGRRLLVLTFLGAAMLALAVVVMVRNRSPDDELLAIIAVLGGVAVIVNELTRHPPDDSDKV
jgi:hypothetical protein